MGDGARDFWRTLDERAKDPAFQEQLWNEFPFAVEGTVDPVARRAFLKLMGASLALAGVTACTRQPQEQIFPYVEQPEEIVPGRPLFYATAMCVGGCATGLLVESHEGRPTKVEGNLLHPGSLGAADRFAQAAILELYDPDRSRTLTNLGEIRPYAAFLGAVRAALTAQQPLKGSGIRILTESVNSPTLAAQIRDVLARFPAAKWHQWDPTSRDNARAGARLAFGDYVEAQYFVARADVILSLDADFLDGGPGTLRYAREFTSRRSAERPDQMNRLYVVESMPTPTGSRADHRMPLKPGDIASVACELASALGISGIDARAGGSGRSQGLGAADQRVEKWVAAVVSDLRAHRGSSLILAGESQPPVVHALAHAMNQTLANVGRTVIYTDPIEAAPSNQLQSLGDLTNDMKAGQVDLLIMLGGNPVYTAPVDLGFADALATVPLRIHLSAYDNETSELCHWQIPEAHFLEAWSDARGYDGTASIVQPLIAPLYGGKSAHEVIAAMTERPEKSAYDIVRDYWRAQPSSRGEQGRNAQASSQIAEFEQRWRRWLHDGLVPDTAFHARTVSANLSAIAQATASLLPPAGGFEIAFKLDPCVLDGRFANNGWLQELPKPISKLTWDNAVIVSPATAEKLNVEGRPSYQGGEHGQISSAVVELRYRNRSIQGPILSMPGHPDDCATVHVGYGRRRAGHLGTGAGFNANLIRTSTALWFDREMEIVPTGRRYPLACTQYHHLMEGRGLVRAVTRDEYVRNPKSVHEGEESPSRTITLHPNYSYEGYKWGMAIDVNACIGCNACVVSCQAENNIPVVGKGEVLRGREMHWLRIDTYYRGELENPETFFQPVPCMHCENAPCEVVCPTGATVHSHEGLNDMVYNRCIGTRYCSNNCPYKVRRFNFFLYQDWDTPSLKLGRNPDVTVRSRGVMEKCTYCVQRINAAKIESESQDRKVRDGEIKTACQQTCPADAIVFGNLNDLDSRVAKLQAQERSYGLLEQLNTRPRTKYLAAIRNVNPELGG